MSKSLVKIAQLLDQEHFSDYTANQITRYWYHHSGLKDRQKRIFKQLKESFQEIMSKLSKPETLVIGKFLGLHKKLSFDAGLKIGLMTLLHNTIEDEEIDETLFTE